MSDRVFQKGIRLAFELAYDRHADFYNLKGMINVADGHNYLEHISFRNTAIRVDKNGVVTSEHHAMFDLGAREYIPLSESTLLDIQKALQTMGFVDLDLSAREAKIYRHIQNEVANALNSLESNLDLAISKGLLSSTTAPQRLSIA